MATQLQLRRGTTTDHTSFTGAVGEVTVDTTKNVLVVHDGTTVGGFPVAARANTDGSVNILARDGTILSTLHAGTKLVDYTPIPYPLTTPPKGYITLMGQVISQSSYPILFSLYGSTLPDLRGVFIRGLDNGKGYDTGREILTYQADELKSHTHSVARAQNSGVGALTDRVTTANGDSGTANNAAQATGGTETRPKNIAFNYIVKAG